MLALKGIYDCGKIELDEELYFDHPVKVIVTFLEESTGQKKSKNKFSFEKTARILEKVRGNLSDEVIQERRKSL